MTDQDKKSKCSEFTLKKGVSHPDAKGDLVHLDETWHKINIWQAGHEEGLDEFSNLSLPEVGAAPLQTKLH